MDQRNLPDRRQSIRGYSPSRRKDVAGIFLGLERRMNQRRMKDRRESLRRQEDHPDGTAFISE